MFIIRYDWRNNSVLFVHNLDEKPREISFSTGLPGDGGKLLINLLAEDHSEADGRGQHRLVLEPYGYRWFRVGGLDYLLKRSDIDTKGRQRPLTRPEPVLPIITPSLPRRSSAPSIFSPCRSSNVDNRISQPLPIALEVTETGSAPRFNATMTALRRRFDDRAEFHPARRSAHRRRSRVAATCFLSAISAL